MRYYVNFISKHYTKLSQTSDLGIASVENNLSCGGRSQEKIGSTFNFAFLYTEGVEEYHNCLVHL